MFNYSKFQTTPAMDSLLNRGLNFAHLPQKLDILQVMVDCKRLGRSMIWQEYWHNRETEAVYKPPIFKKVKTNLPKEAPPKALINFIGAVRSELRDPQNRNQARPNLPPDEQEALNILINLQKSKQIVIKPCDKGAGIIILDFEEYVRACQNHLQSKQP